MRLLLDNNLSYKLKDILLPLYQEIVHVNDLNLHKADDALIWNYARDNGLNIVTKDSDFNDLSFIHGYPPFIIWLKTGNTTTTQVGTILSENYAEILNTIKGQKAGVIEIEV